MAVHAQGLTIKALTDQVRALTEVVEAQLIEQRAQSFILRQGLLTPRDDDLDTIRRDADVTQPLVR